MEIKGPFDKKSLPFICAKVPTQKDFYNCGPFVLKYVEKLTENGEECVFKNTVNNLKNGKLENWFETEDPQELRVEIKNIIHDFADESRKNLEAVRNAFHILSRNRQNLEAVRNAFHILSDNLRAIKEIKGQ